MIDASALLWRLQLRGVDVGSRWQEIADAWTPRLTDGHYAFNDVHALMAFVGDGRTQAAERNPQGDTIHTFTAPAKGLLLVFAAENAGALYGSISPRLMA